MAKQDILIYIDMVDSAAPVLDVELSGKYSKWVYPKIRREWTQEQLVSWDNVERTDIALMAALDGRKSDIIKALCIMGEANMYELAKKLVLSYSVVHRAVTELEKLKIVSTEITGNGDRAETLVKLTAKVLPRSAYVKEKRLDRWDEYRKEVEKDYKNALEEEELYANKFK